MSLQWHDGATYLGKDKKLKLDNNLEVTYGQINGLGGGYFGDEPVCLGKDFEDQVLRFEKAYKSLAGNEVGKSDAEYLIHLKSAEVALLNEAARNNKSVAEVYRNDVPSTRDDLLAGLTGIVSKKPKGYLGLAYVNFDHFGEDAQKAYNAGHTFALRKAASNKDPRTLELAYGINAFADHFLEDSFASGHLRVPRQQLHGYNVARDLCARVSLSSVLYGM